MSYLLFFMSGVLSFLSTCMMTYLAMAIDTGPWVAPVFVTVVMIVLIPLVSRQWFKDHVIVTIAAGSLGGMIGTCIGLTWPAFYFLHESTFQGWMQSPLKFAMVISTLVCAAGSFAFLIANLLREKFVKNFTFPISKLVYDIIYVDQKNKGSELMLHGIAAASTWNVFAWIAQAPLRLYLSQMYIAPLFLSIGFVAGQAMAFSLLIGMLSRMLILNGIKYEFFQSTQSFDFIIMFTSGMLIAVIFLTLGSFLSKAYHKHAEITYASFLKVIKNPLYQVFAVLVCVACAVSLYSWNIYLYEQLYLFLVLFFLSLVVAVIVGEVGVVEIASYTNFITLPMIFFFSTASHSIVAVSVFCTICIGLVIDLLFSYKLAYLAKVPYKRIVMYQVLGFFVAALSVGFVLWWYIDSFQIGSSAIFANFASNYEQFISLKDYNYLVVILGFLYAISLDRVCDDLLIVIGGIVMPASMSFWLILAGGVSYLIKDRNKYYPLCFGIYAGHSAWMLIRTLSIRL